MIKHKLNHIYKLVKYIEKSNNYDILNYLTPTNIETFYHLTKNSYLSDKQIGGQLIDDETLNQTQILHIVYHGKMIENKVLTVPD